MGTGQAVLNPDGTHKTNSKNKELYWKEVNGNYSEVADATASIDADDATLTLTVNELGGLPGYINADVILKDTDEQIERLLRSDVDYRVTKIDVDTTAASGPKGDRDGNTALNLRIGQLERLMNNGVEIAAGVEIVLDPRDTIELSAYELKNKLPNNFTGSIVVTDDGDSLVSELFSNNRWNFDNNNNLIYDDIQLRS